MTASSTVVIGLGMIGAAALRALSDLGRAGQLLGIGPAEPHEMRQAQAPFASHYDYGRITRISDPDLTWATLAQRSIAAYPALSARSGIAFHHPIGHLRLASHTARLDAADAHGRMLGAPISHLANQELAAAFPEIHFPPAAEALLEGGGAGWIAPRALVAAQLTIAAQQGAGILRDVAETIRRVDGAYLIETRAGHSIRAEQVLISADASSIALLDGLIGRRPALTTHAYTVVYAEVGPEQQATYRATPTLIWPLPDHPFLASIYTTSAADLPDGRSILKIGGTPREPHVLHTADEWQAWFRSPGRSEEISALQAVLQAIYPDLRVQAWGAKTCANSYTAHGLPYIEQIGKGLVLCSGGCGAAAKSSDAIGVLGARLLAEGNWNDSLAGEQFQIVWDR